MSPAKRMFTKLKNDKGMVYVMEAVEDVAKAFVTRRLTQAEWYKSAERRELKERVGCLVAFAGDIPSTKKALLEHRAVLVHLAHLRSELTGVLSERLRKVRDKK